MRKGLAGIAALLALPSPIAAAPLCERPEDAAAVQAAALQQEMMVAALMCREVGAYNHFVLSHRTDLQESDHRLLAFFVAAEGPAGDADYNLFKTELANASSLRSTTDRYFCARAKANFRVAANRPLAEFLRLAPYPADTGSVRCPQSERMEATVPEVPVRKRPRHRTWLGRLVDGVFR